MNKISDLEQYVQNHLEDAIAQDWIIAYFQPVVRSLTGELSGFEALARWNDPTYGFLTPDIFIPPLEKNGKIYLLDLAVLEIICKNYKEQHDSSFDFIPVSFNLSRLDLEISDIHERINFICDKYDVPHNMIHIEITENSSGEKEEALEEHIQWFHRDGFEVWMDDFGSGLSTLNTLQTHSFDVIKLDMMFLRHFNKKGELILRSIIKMAKNLGIGTVCEGVETMEHSQFLKETGCERIQGWYYGRPQPVEVIKGLVHNDEHNYETADEQVYWNNISSIDLLSGYPEMIVEYSDHKWIPVAINKQMIKAFREIHPEENIKVLGMSMSPQHPLYNMIDDLFSQVSRTRESHKIDYIDSGFLVLMKAAYIASLNDKTALKVTLRNIYTELEYKRNSMLENGLVGLYSQFELVNLISPDRDSAMQIYSNASFEKIYGQGSLLTGIKEFTETEVFIDDRERYRRFMDMSTLERRYKEQESNYLTEPFRLKDKKGGFRWKQVTLLKMLSDDERQYLYEIQPVSKEKRDALDKQYGKDMSRS
ncbi:MAG: EAL domain-containing protein [Lachnospiraceae bacterium]|nr:EAL domain-containing protein [Lachnospiraceae bacterium]